MFMLKKYALFLYAFFMFAVCSFAQQSFMSKIGGAGNDEFYSVKPTSDGGYISTGMTNSFGIGGGNFLLTKMDGDGNIQWARSYGGHDQEFGYSIAITKDEGYIMTGVSASFGLGKNDIYVVKTDRSGTLEWSKVYGNRENDAALKIQPTHDGGYVLAGRYSFDSANTTVGYCLKISNMGEVQWSKTFKSNKNRSTTFNDIKELKKGGYVVTGLTEDFDEGAMGNSDIVVVRLDSVGNTLWTKLIGTKGRELGNTVSETKDGGFILAGTTSKNIIQQADLLLIKLDGTGNIGWSKSYGTRNNERVYDILQLPNGYVIQGDTGVYFTSDMYMMKTDLNGNMNWAKIYPLTYSKGCKSTGFALAADSGFIAAGFYNLPGSLMYNGVLVKTDKNGVLACGERNFSLTLTNPNLSVRSWQTINTLPITSAQSVDTKSYYGSFTNVASFCEIANVETPAPAKSAANATGGNEKAFFREDEASNNVELYPNPATVAFYLLTGSSETKRTFDVVITDATGHIISETKNFCGTQSIDISDMDLGLYFVKIYENNELLEIKKLFKE